MSEPVGGPGVEVAVSAEAAPAGAPGSEPASVPEESEEVRALRERLRERERPSHIGVRVLVFLASLAAFVWFMRDSGPIVIVAIVCVLLLHEAGHFVAMRALGYENMRVFFVPFLGAAVAGRARKPGGWRAGVVSLAGPVPGIVLAALLLVFASSSPLVRVAVVSLVFLNGLNLLPFVPLDGGRVLATVLFSRHRYLELGGTVMGAVGLVAVPDLLPGNPAIWAGLMVSVVIQRARQLEHVASLRASALDLEGPTSELPAETLLALRDTAARMLERSLGGEKAHASAMASLHEEAATRPAQWSHALVLFAVWAGAAGLAWTTLQAVKHPTARWEPVVSAEAGFSVSFPAPPRVETKEHPTAGVAVTRTWLARLGEAEFSILSLTLEDDTIHFEELPEEADGRMRAMAALSAETAHWTITSQLTYPEQGKPALAVSFRGPDGLVVNSMYVATGNSVHVVGVSRAPLEQQGQFFQSFRLAE